MENTGYALARAALIRTLSVYSGITTEDGDVVGVRGTTLVDSNLIDRNDFISEKTILIMSGDAKDEDKGAIAFDNSDGKITLQGDGVSAQIKAGTIFRVLNISSVETLINNLTVGLISFRGTTTEDGGAGGSSLICSDLADEADFNGNQVVIAAGDYRGQARDIIGITTGGTVTPHLDFGGVIVEGTEFVITAIRVVPAEVAAIAADLGDMADAATNDNMSDIATTSALAKLRLILNRLSPDAFSATIHAGARTSLDTMLAEMAKYFVADGGGFDLKINNGVNRDNLNLIMRDFFTVIGILDTSIWQPTIGGGTQATVVAAVQALANYWAPLGAGLDIKINNGVSRDDLKNILKDYFAVFGISDTSIWQPVIAGGARTTVVAAVQALANLWTPPGEGLDFKINNGTNKNSLKEILQDFFTMVGCLDTSVFNPTIGGSARTTFDDAWAAMATYFAAGGAAIAATVDPGGSERATLELILEDLGKILAGGGITTYPAVASPGNGVNMAAVLRAIVNSLTGSDTYTDYTKINNVASTSLDGALQALAGVFAAAGTGVFEPTIQGSARADMELALFALASYFVSAAGAYSIKVNNQDLRTNLEQILQDFFAVVGCDGTNAFNPSVGGSERTTIEAAFEALDTIIDTIDGIVDDIKTQTDKIAGKMLFSMDFWSDPAEEVVMTGGQTTPGLPSVAVGDLPTNATIVRAIAMFKFRMVENTNAAENSLDKTAAQPIQVQEPANGEAYTDAINFVDEQFTIAATTREGGDVLIGSIDIGTKVVANETYSFRWLNAKAHLGNLQFNDVQTGLRIWYSL